MNSGHRRGSFEARLERLKNDEPADGRAAPGQRQGAVVPRRTSSVSGQPKGELSDKAASLIATVLKDFLRD